MKPGTCRTIGIILAVSILLAPLVTATQVPFGNSFINTDSEFSGDAVVNNTIDIKWTTWDDNQPNTYEWKDTSILSNTTSQRTHSALNLGQDSSSSWIYQRTGFMVPSKSGISQYMDSNTISRSAFLSGRSLLPLMPGIQLI